MNKKIITGLILIMGLSILGIIIIQLIWMNNAIRVRNEMFDRSVNEALNSTTNRLETMQDFHLINQFAFGDSLHSFGNPPPPPLPPGSFGRGQQRIVLSGRPDSRIEMIVKSKMNQSGKHIEIETKSNLDGHQNIVFIHGDSIARTLDSVYSREIVQIDSVIAQFDTQTDSIRKLKQRVELKSHKLKRLANKVVREITTWEEEVPIERITEVLKRELHNRNIPISFELGILKDSVFTKTTAQSDKVLLSESKYKVDMFPNGIFEKNSQLVVYFPDKESFILKALNWLLIISILFSIIVLLSFAASIYFILKQKRISEMKADFINNMTHEFKTPIATISVAADSVINTKVIGNPDKIRHFIELIKKENTRMNRQVEDILTIASLDRKEFEFNWEVIDLHEVIEEAIQVIVLQIEKKGGTLTSELKAENPVATSDRTHFANMVYNLLDNANKYTIGTPVIKIITRNTQLGVIVEVTDNGIGMSKAVQSRIFERFYRQSSGNIHNVKGFGLGLSYVKAVLEANRGNINVWSEPGIGSRFEVFIPFIRE